jgi:hypothetical protein
MITEHFDFLSTIFSGPFIATNTKKPNPPNPKWGWKSFSAQNASLDRWDSDMTFALAPAANMILTPLTDALKSLGGIVTVTGGPYAQIALWQQTPCIELKACGANDFVELRQ